MSAAKRDPVEPLTPMAESVANMHELFSTLIVSGFTEWQACRILGVLLAESTRQQ